MDICICRAESLCWSPETIRTLLTSYTPIQNKKLKKKKKHLTHHTQGRHDCLRMTSQIEDHWRQLPANSQCQEELRRHPRK